jgi:hypothetical protein
MVPLGLIIVMGANRQYMNKNKQNNATDGTGLKYI